MQSALSTLKEKGGLNERAVTSFAECQRLVDKQAFDRTYRCSDRRKIARGEDVALQAAVWAAIESGEHPIRAIRKYRGLTQIDVAEQAGLRQGYIADIEAGKKTGSATSLKDHCGRPWSAARRHRGMILRCRPRFDRSFWHSRGDE